MGGDMRKLIVSSLVSLDGIHGDPQSWVGEFFDEQAVQESLATLLDSDAMLMGRNTYEYFAPAWSSPSGPYLERINEMPKYVFSSTLTAADWNNTTIIPGDPVATVRELKDRGSGTTLFRPGKRMSLRLTSVTQRRNGVVILSYASA
jgi:dihydrofolate reductase